MAVGEAVMRFDSVAQVVYMFRILREVRASDSILLVLGVHVVYGQVGGGQDDFDDTLLTLLYTTTFFRSPIFCN